MPDYRDLKVGDTYIDNEITYEVTNVTDNSVTAVSLSE